MSLCRVCQSFGTWLNDKDTILRARSFLTKLYKNQSQEPKIKFEHHKTILNLQYAAQKGCPLCQLITRCEPRIRETIEAAPLVFRFHALDGYSIHLENDGWTLDSNLEVYIQREPKARHLWPPENPEIWQCSQHLGSHPLSQSTVSIMNGSLDECLETHEKCNGSRMSGYSPTRLLDVGPRDGSVDPFLIELKDFPLYQLPEESEEIRFTRGSSPQQRGNELPVDLRYTTLSHCWGGTPHLQTTKESLELRKQSVSISSMNATFRNAVEVTRSLGIEYLWIDSLCIMQDSEIDWLQESAKMSLVYKNAFVNIAAISSASGDEPFLHDRPPTVRIPQFYPGEEENVPPAQPIWIRLAQFNRHILPGKYELATRARCFQEEVLSPRALMSGHSQVFFECRRHRRCEDNPGLYTSKINPEIRVGDTFSYLTQKELLGENECHQAMDMWHKMVNSYSGVELSFAKDKLPAISGLASQLGPLMEGTYLAGIWSYDLPYGLCWEVHYDQYGKEHCSRDRCKAVPYRAPTWSWASQNGVVHYLKILTSQIVWEISILNYGIDCISGDAYGQVKAGYIELQGRISEVHCGQDDFHRDGKLHLRQKDGSIISVFTDEGDLDVKDGLFWCLLLGASQRREPKKCILRLMIIKQIEGSENFERVGLIREHQVQKARSKALWDGVERRSITLV